jgi:hypothetical protein
MSPFGKISGKHPALWRVVARRERGFLLISAIFILVVLAALVVALANISAVSSASSGQGSASGQAYFYAYSGLERATFAVGDTAMTTRQTCVSLTSMANVAVGAGQYSVTAADTSYASTPTSLSASVTAAATRIPVVDISNYVTDGGRVMINRELIDYAQASTSVPTCVPVAQPCLVVSRRGADGTTPSAHASGTKIGQYQCDVKVVGATPNSATPAGARILTQATQLQEIWAAGAPGATAANQPWFVRFQDTTWENLATTAVTTNDTITAISVLSYADGFAVGTAGATAALRPLVMRWNGSTWPSVNTGLGVNRTLNSVSCLSANDCWMVGASGGAGQRPWIVRQSNGIYSNVNTAAININVALNRVYCVSTNECYAVGAAGGGGHRPFVLSWDGAAWTSPVLNFANVALLGLHCVATNDCWAVGARGATPAQRPLTIHWDGTAWTATDNTALNDNLQLNEVYCVATNDCWAVGNAGGAGLRPYLIHWNGTAWSAYDSTALNLNATLNGITCSRSSDCWAVGNAIGGAELILHWDGSAWTRYTDTGGLVDNRNLTWVKGIGAAQMPYSARREVFP